MVDDPVVPAEQINGKVKELKEKLCDASPPHPSWMDSLTGPAPLAPKEPLTTTSTEGGSPLDGNWDLQLLPPSWILGCGFYPTSSRHFFCLLLVCWGGRSQPGLTMAGWADRAETWAFHPSITDESYSSFFMTGEKLIIAKYTQQEINIYLTYPLQPSMLRKSSLLRNVCHEGALTLHSWLCEKDGYGVVDTQPLSQRGSEHRAWAVPGATLLQFHQKSDSISADMVMWSVKRRPPLYKMRNWISVSVFLIWDKMANEWLLHGRQLSINHGVQFC